MWRLDPSRLSNSIIAPIQRRLLPDAAQLLQQGSRPVGAIARTRGPLQHYLTVPLARTSRVIGARLYEARLLLEPRREGGGQPINMALSEFH